MLIQSNYFFLRSLYDNSLAMHQMVVFEQFSVENMSKFKKYILNTVLRYLISAVVVKSKQGLFKLWM